MDTIFAQASGVGKAGVSVVRISGPLAKSALLKLAGKIPPERRASLRILRSAAGDVMDQALVFWFAGPQSFTGEDVVELHLHGSIAVTGMVLRELGSLDGLRLAEPGEFTRRALENNRMDLAQIEGLSDLIDAETEAQQRQAMRVMSGALGEAAADWRGKLIRAASLLEVTIDFADEEVPVDVTDEVLGLIEEVAKSLRGQVAGTKIAERIRHGFEVAIVGPPNIGKSTLLNALAGREAAITSEHAGTTRDIVEVRLNLDGLPVTVLDTAGLRETEDAVEKIGIKRAKERAEEADLRVFLTEPGSQPAMEVRDGDLVLAAKADLHPGIGDGISGKTGAGLDRLIAALSENLAQRVQGAGIATRERHRTAMQRALSDLSAATQWTEQGPDVYELAAEELRSAVLALDSLIGRVGVEDLLDEIFASFCLGK